MPRLIAMRRGALVCGIALACARDPAVLGNGHAQGALGQVLEVALDDLVAGDNVLELETRGIPQNYPPAASAIDLVLAE